ncbi:protein angel homolog 2 isoform X2 [Hyla sarda]|uniref:protein angel homolog 2 isoform X2 n=1 Tax=Hyla sarda TaxID=327740 RepID=UPI0024C3A29E|nr:protein angel homolog 2 isoform X2 [Hyla sarda]
MSRCHMTSVIIHYTPERRAWLLIGYSGYSMLPRHLQTVGGRCFARAGDSRPLCMSGNFFSYPWWTGYWQPSPHYPVNGWHPQDNSRPFYSFGPHRPAPPGSHTLPCFPAQSLWLHVSPFNMDVKGDEPFRKRKKSTEEDEYRRKSWTKRPYPPASDFRVPPIDGTPEMCVPTSPQTEAKAEVKRRWEDFSHHYQESSSTEKFDFTLMSYNILSQDLLEDNSSLYSHCRRPHLFWHYRLPNILRELQEMNADILCLQEVQEDHYQEQIKPRLEALGYTCAFKARTGSKPDGCAICFKSAKFKLKLVKPVEYFRRDIPLLDRDNVGLVLMLQPKARGRDASMICVANTHLLYNPRRGDIKLTQLAILLAEITEVVQTPEGGFCPIVLCGDFNSVPGSPLHQFIKEGALHYEGMPIGKVSGQEKYPRGQRILSNPIWPRSLGINQKCVYKSPETNQERLERSLEEQTPEEQRVESDKSVESRLRHHFSLSSVYSHYFPDTGMPEITTCHSKSAITVDYIFYSPANTDVFRQPGSDVSCNGLQLLGRLSLLTEQDLWSVNGLPNETISSDHISLMAKFRLEL